MMHRDYPVVVTSRFSDSGCTSTGSLPAGAGKRCNVSRGSRAC